MTSEAFKYPFPHREQLNLSCVSVLCSLLKHNINEWLHATPKEKLLALCHRLLGETQRLNNQDLSSPAPQYTLPFALRSTCLLSLIQWRHDIELKEYENTINTSQLVENVIKFTFSHGDDSQNQSPGGGNGGFTPAWIHASYEAATFHMLRSIGQDLVHIWSMTGGAAGSVLDKQDRRWRHYVETFWTQLLNKPSYIASDILNGILLLLSVRRLTARSVLHAVLHSQTKSDRYDEYLVEPCRLLLSSLIELCRNVSTMTSVDSIFVRFLQSK